MLVLFVFEFLYYYSCRGLLLVLFCEVASMSTVTSTEMGPISATTERVRSRVQGVVAPHVEGPLKVVQEKYELLKTEYPSTKPTLESAERTISDLSDRVSKGYVNIVKRGDDAIQEKIMAPVAKARAVVENEADKEEVKDVKNTGQAFMVSLVTLVSVYVSAMVSTIDKLTEKYIPDGKYEKEVVRAVTTDDQKQTLQEQTVSAIAKIVNRVFGFLSEKSTLKGDVDFYAPTTLKGYITPSINAFSMLVLGSVRYVCEAVESYKGVADYAVQKMAQRVLSATDFSVKKKSPAEEVSTTTAEATDDLVAPESVTTDSISSENQ